METQPSTENASSKPGEGNNLLLSNTVIEAVLVQQKKAGSNLSLADHLCGVHFNSNWFAHALPVLSHQMTVCDHYSELPAVESRE